MVRSKISFGARRLTIRWKGFSRIFYVAMTRAFIHQFTDGDHMTVAALATAALFTVALCRASSSPDFARSKMSSPITAAALPNQPEDWPRQFEEQLNAGDLDGVMALYEKDARFVTRTGETLVGRDAIRKELGGLIEAKTQFHSRVVRATIIGEMAQLYTDFESTTKEWLREYCSRSCQSYRSPAPSARWELEVNHG
jgi:hypothetical protein